MVRLLVVECAVTNARVDIRLLDDKMPLASAVSNGLVGPGSLIITNDMVLRDISPATS